MENAVVHLLASRRENFGLTTLEALSVGCEAIVPRHHLAASILGEWVHSFDPDRSDSLATTIRRLLARETRPPSFPRRRFAPAAVVGELLRFYERTPTNATAAEGRL
jgi:hypothetical protein